LFSPPGAPLWTHCAHRCCLPFNDCVQNLKDCVADDPARGAPATVAAGNSLPFMRVTRVCGELPLSSLGSRLDASVRWAAVHYGRTLGLRRSLCSSSRRRFDSSSESIFLSIPCIHAPSPQTRYETLLLLHKASRFGDVLVNTVKVIFEAHSSPHSSGFEPRPPIRCLLMPHRGRNRLLLLGHEWPNKRSDCLRRAGVQGS
jgi:hypothetical protein